MKVSVAAAFAAAALALSFSPAVLAVNPTISAYCRDDVPASDPHKRPGGWCEIIAQNDSEASGNFDGGSPIPCVEDAEPDEPGYCAPTEL